MTVKYLIQDGTDILAYTTQWEDIGEIPVTRDMFDMYGMAGLGSLSRASKDFSYNLSSPTILGSGKIFSQNVNLKKLIDVTNIKLK